MPTLPKKIKPAPRTLRIPIAISPDEWERIKRAVSTVHPDLSPSIWARRVLLEKAAEILLIPRAPEEPDPLE